MGCCECVHELYWNRESEWALWCLICYCWIWVMFCKGALVHTHGMGFADYLLDDMSMIRGL